MFNALGWTIEGVSLRLEACQAHSPSRKLAGGPPALLGRGCF
jgi:hypothetical protein